MAKSIARTVLIAVFMFVSIVAAQSATVTKAVDIAVDKNNNSYVLLLNSDGSNTLNKLNASGTVLFSATYGPYSGETATALSVGQDSVARILWVGSTHTMTVWAVNTTTGAVHYSPFYGPYTTASGSQYNPIGIATGSDNLTRVLWASTDGYCTFWTLNESGGLTYSPTYRPDPNYNAVGIAAGSSTVRLLWRKNDNTTTFWTVPSTINSTGTVTFGKALAPQSGFVPTDIALDGNNIVYILFNNISGQTDLWSVASSASSSPATSNFYSLYHTWMADCIAVSTASSASSTLRLLWSSTGDTNTLWSLSTPAIINGVPTGGLITGSLDIGPVSTEYVGTHSQAPLLASTEGFFYGTTYDGGVNNHSTVFRTDTSGNTKVIYTFGSQPSSTGPVAGLIRSSDGFMYGTTIAGGSNNTGTVYKISPYGALTVLHSFGPATGTDGINPRCRLLLDSLGVLMGTTYAGGQHGQGTVFRINPDGTAYTVVHNFDASQEGANPTEGIIQVGDFQNFYYGVCGSGGNSGSGVGYGSVFRMNYNGTTFNVLKYFTGGADGSGGNSELTYVSANRSLYGSTMVGGGNPGYGNIYKIDSFGNYSNVHSFSVTDGQNPSKGPLYISSDGNLYGTTNSGGANSRGVIYRLNISSNAYTTLHSVTSAEGFLPNGGLVLGSDGYLYGTLLYDTPLNGGSGNGSIFKTTTAGVLTNIYSF